MEQENIMQQFMDLYDAIQEDAGDAQVAVDATKLAQDFKAKVGQEITKKVGATPNATPNAPKLVNKAVVDAAKTDPVTAAKALNPTQQMMKKENRFPTLAQWREAVAGR